MAGDDLPAARVRGGRMLARRPCRRRPRDRGRRVGRRAGDGPVAGAPVRCRRCPPTPAPRVRSPPGRSPVGADPELLDMPVEQLRSAPTGSATRPTAAGSPSRPRSSSRSPCCAATAAATAPSPRRRPASTSPYLTPDEVLAIARAGRAAGCHEALFTLGERPELRYPVAARVAGRPRATPRRSTTSPPCAASCWRRPACSPTPTPAPSTPTSWPRCARCRPARA